MPKLSLMGPGPASLHPRVMQASSLPLVRKAARKVVIPFSCAAFSLFVTGNAALLVCALRHRF